MSKSLWGGDVVGGRKQGRTFSFLSQSEVIKMEQLKKKLGLFFHSTVLYMAINLFKNKFQGKKSAFWEMEWINGTSVHYNGES